MHTDYAIGQGFACTYTLPANPTVFGSDSLAFPNKKAARHNAAREAMQFLIAQGLASPDGSVGKGKKKGLSGGGGGGATVAVKMQGGGLEVKRDSSYAQRVNGES